MRAYAPPRVIGQPFALRLLDCLERRLPDETVSILEALGRLPRSDWQCLVLHDEQRLGLADWLAVALGVGRSEEPRGSVEVTARDRDGGEAEQALGGNSSWIGFLRRTGMPPSLAAGLVTARLPSTRRM